MGSTYSESRRPSRDTIRSGYIDDDINIPHRSMLQAARRRQETKALLASPGPLESMLKTTTETGDIGVYSIRPTRSFSRAQPPLHPAITSSGTILTRSMSVNARDRRHARDDRRGPLVHRNATSEIVSLYDSTGQRSMHGPFSRSLDDGGPRSYSLTSCSSRYMSDQKSTGTWDSRSSGGSGGSGGLMPRPRSPYPYHTRLKRPGIRPSSPALTQDGTIDYSQMVEVNRPSYRTIHRSYGRSYPPNLPRYARPPHQAFDTYDTRSPQGDGDSYMLSRHVSGAAPPSPWINQTSGQVEGSFSGQSAGVSSIASIVQLYASPVMAPAASQPPIARTGSFYYDYSEDFQTHSVPLPRETGSAMSRRMPSTHHSAEPDDAQDYTASARASVESADAIRPPTVDKLSPDLAGAKQSQGKWPIRGLNDGDETVRTGSEETSAQPETIRNNDEASVPDLASEDPSTETSTIASDAEMTSINGVPELTEPVVAASGACRTIGTQQQEQLHGESRDADVSASTPSATHLPSDLSRSWNLTTDQRDEPGMPETPSAIAESAAGRLSQSSTRSSGHPDTPSLAARRRSNVYSLQPGLMDLKSFVQDLEDAGLLHDAGVSGNADNSQHSSTHADQSSGANVSAVLARTKHVLESEPERTNIHTHVREPAVSSVIRRLKTNAAAEHRCQSGDDTKSVILAPQPVSPARQLRLRSSVSKLMKALPPVPLPPHDHDNSGEHKSFAERKLPELPVPPRISLSGFGEPSPFHYTPESFTQTNKHAGINLEFGNRNDVAAHPAGHDQSSRATYDDFWNVGVGKDEATVPISSGLTLPKTSAPGMIKHAKCMTGTHRDLGDAARQLHRLPNGANIRSSTTKSKPALRETSACTNLIFAPRPASLDSSRSTSSQPPVPPRKRRAFEDHGSATQTRPQRGLRERLSDFKIRITESRQRPTNWPSSNAVVQNDGEVIGLAIPVTSSSGSPESGGESSNSNSAADEASGGGLRQKLSRWMKLARYTVNSCKRLSTSTGDASLDTNF